MDGERGAEVEVPKDSVLYQEKDIINGPANQVDTNDIHDIHDIDNVDDVDNVQHEMQVKPLVLIEHQALMKSTEDTKLKFEQQAHDFESQLFSLTNLNKSITSDLSAKERIEVEQKAIISLLKQQISNQATQMQTHSSLKLNNHTSTAVTEAVAEKERECRAQSLDISRKESVITGLDSEIISLTAQLVASQEDLRDERKKFIDFQLLDHQSKATTTIVKKELMQSQQQLDWANKELSSKVDEMAQYRVEKSNRIIKLEALIENSSEERSNLETRNQLLQKRADGIEEKLSAKIDRIRRIEDERVVAEQQFKIEVQSQQNLADLYKGKSIEISSHNTKLEELVRDLESRLINLAQSNESQKASSKNQVLQLEQKIADQSASIVKMREDRELLDAQFTNQNTSIQIGQLSKTAAAESLILKSGHSVTQIYSDNALLRQELSVQKTEVVRLQECLDHIVCEFEVRAPLIQKTNDDYQRSLVDISAMAIDLALAVRLKNEADVGVKALDGLLKAGEVELRLLRGDVRDLGHQVQVLLREQRLSNGDVRDIDDDANIDSLTLNESDADAIISQRLVTFKNIEGLQSQNQGLLRSIRSLSARMEIQELESNACLERMKIERVDESTIIITQLQDRLRSEMLNRESFERERDQWRAISGNNKPSAINSSIQQELTPISPDFALFYRDLHLEFDVYRKECAIDIKMIKGQLEEKNQLTMQLSIQIAKSDNQTVYLNERHELLLKSLEGKKCEVEQMHIQLQKLNCISARQDIKIEEYAASLILSRQTVESLANENRQIKFDKEVWRASEDRYIKESAELVWERNVTNDRLNEIQNNVNDQDKIANDKIRKFEEQIEGLMRDVRLYRKQVTDLTDDNRILASKREAEVLDSSFKLQHIQTDLDSAKYSLSLAVQSESQHTFEAKELVAKITSLEKRSLSFEPRLSSRSSNPDTSRIVEDDLVRVQVLLNTMKVDLELANEQVETFRAISLACEERLKETNQTYDLYTTEMNLKLSNAETVYSNLKLEFSRVNDDLIGSQNSVIASEERLQGKIEESDNLQRLNLKELESVRLAEERALICVAGIKIDLDRQVLATEDAQKNYEREIISHSVSLQQLNTLKLSTSELKLGRDTALSEYQVAYDKCKADTKFFDDLKLQLEQEIGSMKQRIADLLAQNKLLHSQFEQGLLFKARTVDLDNVDENGDTSYADLAEVIKFLRREKEIVETKLRSSMQEIEKSRLQIQSQLKMLDKGKLLLDQERKRDIDLADMENKHKELLEKIEQANLLRESNITLRSQLADAQSRSNCLEASLSQSESLINPLNEGEIELRKAESKSLNEDNLRWKGRAQQILEKYERIDPVEYVNLKQNVAQFAAEKLALETNLSVMTSTFMARLDQKDAAIKQSSFEIVRLTQSTSDAKAINPELLNQINELNQKLEASITKNQQITQGANERLKSAYEKIKEFKKQVNDLLEERQVLELKLRTSILNQSIVVVPSPGIELLPVINQPMGVPNDMDSPLESVTTVAENVSQEIVIMTTADVCAPTVEIKNIPIVADIVDNSIKRVRDTANQSTPPQDATISAKRIKIEESKVGSALNDSSETVVLSRQPIVTAIDNIIDTSIANRNNNVDPAGAGVGSSSRVIVESLKVDRNSSGSLHQAIVETITVQSNAVGQSRLFDNTSGIISLPSTTTKNESIANPIEGPIITQLPVNAQVGKLLSRGIEAASITSPVQSNTLADGADSQKSKSSALITEVAKIAADRPKKTKPMTDKTLVEASSSKRKTIPSIQSSLNKGPATPSPSPSATSIAEKKKKTLLLQSKMAAEKAKSIESSENLGTPVKAKPEISEAVKKEVSTNAQRIARFGRGRGSQIKVRGKGRGQPRDPVA